jgi:anti-sigma regulatory factor (Ser/Thr protein kinase)
VSAVDGAGQLGRDVLEGDTLSNPSARSATSTRSTRSTRLTRTPATGSAARTFVVDTLRAWQVGEHARDDAELVVSELVSNAFLHGGAGEVGVSVVDRGDVVRLEVSHREAGPDPVGSLSPQMAGAAQTHGRGLAIVDVLSQAWGVDEHDGERRVWADMVAARSGLLAAADRDAAVAELALALRVPTTAPGVGEEVARWARVRLAVDFVGLVLPDDAAPDHLRFVAANPPLATAAEVRFPVSADRPAAAAHRDGRAYFHESRTAVIARFPDLGPLLAAAGLTALADVPLLDQLGRPRGALALAWSHGRELDAGDRSWLEAVAAVTAAALVGVDPGT